MEYVVDFQAYKLTANEYAVKELAIIPLGGEAKQYIFKPPCDWDDLSANQQRENEWLRETILFVDWNDGDYPYDKIESLLQELLSDAKTIYIKGEEKAKWLKRYVNNVQEIDHKCPSINSLHFEDLLDNYNRKYTVREYFCKFRADKYRAFRIVTLLERWIRIHRPCLERSLEIFAFTRHLYFMSRWDIACLPKDFILNFAEHCIHPCWSLLPEEYQQDEEFQMRKVCTIHDHSNKRISPMIKNCKECFKKN